MRVLPHVAIPLAIAMLTGSPADAGVKVTFAGVGPRVDQELRSVPVTGALRAHLQRLGARLDRSLDLKIDVRSIQLAGIDASMFGPYSFRLMTGATWPSIQLRYVLTRNSKQIASGKETLSDPFYLSNPSSSGDPLVYEKRLLNDWFNSRFASHLKAGG